MESTPTSGQFCVNYEFTMAGLNIAMIPARMGSQRLKRKNLRKLNGTPLIVRGIRKCIEASVFDEVWVNSEHSDFQEITEREGAFFHQRPKYLGNNIATSEQFLKEFLERHECERLFQVHSIAPLLKIEEIKSFVRTMTENQYDVLLSYEPIQIECAFDSRPINFTFFEKTNSQDLNPIQRITWSISAWRRDSFLDASRNSVCATYHGKVGFYPVSRWAAHVIKTKEDLKFAEAIIAAGLV